MLFYMPGYIKRASRVGTAHGLTYDRTNQNQTVFNQLSRHYFATLMLDQIDICTIIIGAVGNAHPTIDEFLIHLIDYVIDELSYSPISKFIKLNTSGLN